MKKIIIVLLTLFFTTVSYATSENPGNNSGSSSSPITIINSGKAGGSFNARTQIYKDGLIAKGYDIMAMPGSRTHHPPIVSQVF